MSYDLAVWQVERPRSDQHAAAVHAQLMDALEEAEPAPPSPAIVGYVSALLARWPDITTEAGDSSPWADGPLIGNASGSSNYFSMVWSMAEEASAFAAQLAREQGLVCFDPQSGTLRPATPDRR